MEALEVTLEATVELFLDMAFRIGVSYLIVPLDEALATEA